jgi:hypothetical protein
VSTTTYVTITLIFIESKFITSITRVIAITTNIPKLHTKTRYTMKRREKKKEMPLVKKAGKPESRKAETREHGKT